MSRAKEKADAERVELARQLEATRLREESALPMKAESATVSPLAALLGSIVKDPSSAPGSTKDSQDDTVDIWTFAAPDSPDIHADFLRLKTDASAWRFGLTPMPCRSVAELGLKVTQLSRKDGSRGFFEAWYKVEGGPLDGALVKVFPIEFGDTALCSILPGTRSYWASQGITVNGAP